MPAAAIIPTDTARGRLGHAAALGDRLAGDTVLTHTVRRAASIPSVDRIVLVHPPGQDPASLLDTDAIGKPVQCAQDPSGSPDLSDAMTPQWVAARKWSMTAWRGGLGFSTVFDELLPPAVLLAGLDAAECDAAIVVRGDWCAFDAVLGEAQLALHLEYPEAMKFTFTQAPPGLGGVALCRSVLEQLMENGAGFGRAVGYNTHKPTVDPISREANLAIPADVRDCARRFIYDTPRAKRMIRRIADRLGARFAEATAAEIVATVRSLESESPDLVFTDGLPQLATLELTPRRAVDGPITPHAYVDFDRPDLDEAVARSVFEQLGDPGDVALMLGGLGDAMLHSGYREMIHEARRAGVLGLGLETDLLCDRDEAVALLDLPLDVVSVRFNADTAATYEQTMGRDAFAKVAENLSGLVQERARREETGRSGGPWIAVKMVKTRETLPDMEGFFERWLRSGAMSVIEPACSGCGLMPEQSPIPMAPPRREPCRQLGQRITIHSDGHVAQCDQDWLARAPLGDARLEPLADIWKQGSALAKAHREGRATELTLCGQCVEWHRP